MKCSPRRKDHEWHKLDKHDFSSNCVGYYYCPICCKDESVYYKFEDNAKDITFFTFKVKCDCGWFGSPNDLIIEKEAISKNRTDLIERMLK